VGQPACRLVARIARRTDVSPSLSLSLSLSCFSLFSFHGAHASGARLPFLYSRGESRMQRRDPASRTSIRHCRRDIPAAEPTRMKNSSQPGSYIGALTAGNLHPLLDPPRSVYRYAAILYARRRRPREIPKREMLERIHALTRGCVLGAYVRVRRAFAPAAIDVTPHHDRVSREMQPFVPNHRSH